MMASRKIGEAFVQVRPDTKGFTKDAEPHVEKSGSEAGGRFTAGFKVAAAAGVAAVVATVAAAVSAGMKKQDVAARLGAQIGLSPQEAASAGRIAGQVYAENFGESLEDVAAAFKAVSRASELLGDGTDASMRDVTERALTLRDVFEQDLGGSVRAAQQLIRNGLAPDAKAAFDLIAAGIQRGLDKSDDLLDTLNEYSTEFRSLGLEGPQALGLIRQALQAGARDSDTVADALKEFAIRAKDASTTSAQGFAKLGLNAKQMTAIFARGGPGAAQALDTVLDRLRALTDPVARNTAAVALFGTKAEDLQAALFALDPSTAAREFGNFAGTVDAASKQVGETASANIESMIRTLKTGFTDLVGGRIIPIVTQFTAALKERLSPALSEANQWVQANVLPRLRELGDYIQAKVVPIVVDLGRRLREDGGAAFAFIQQKIAENRPQIEQFISGLKAVAAFIVEKILPVVGPLLSASIHGAALTIAFIITQIRFWVDAFNAVRHTVTDVVTWVKNKVGELLDLGEKMRETGRNIVRGIWDGVTSLAEWFKDQILGFIRRNITDPIKGALKLGSPSRLMHGFGMDTVRGYAQGVLAAAGEVASAISDTIPGFAPAGPAAPAPAAAGGDLVRAVEAALERVLSRATLRIDDRTARFADLLARGG